MSTGLTRAQIKAEVRAYLMNVDLNQAGWTDAELNAYLDEGAFYIQQLTNSLWDYAVIPVVANQADYTLPDNQYQLIRSCFDRQFLPQTTEYELDRDTSSAWRGDPTGTPCRFYLSQFNVASLYQKPRTSGNAYVTSGNILASDSFNRANENPILAPWVLQGGAVFFQGQISGNQYIGQNTIQTANLYDGGIVWPADQSSQATLRALGVNSGLAGLVVRGNTANQDCYVFTVEAFAGEGIGLPCLARIHRLLGVTTTFLATTTITPQIGDVFKIQVIGTVITCFQNGALILTATDSSTASGKPGMLTLSIGAASAIAWDDWSGGTFGIANGEAQNFTLPDNVTIDSSFSFSSEFGCVTQLINTNGSSINRFESDPQNRFVNPDYGIVVAFADETQNLSFMYVAQPDTMFDDLQEPQFQETFHPAMVYYALMRCFARDGEFQDMEVAQAWYQAFLDWMDSALQASAKEFPTMVKSAEPYGVGNILSARLQAVGPPSQMIIIGTP